MTLPRQRGLTEQAADAAIDTPAARYDRVGLLCINELGYMELVW
ncbi:hypothetical protein ACFYQA_38515 [Streptomyces sp. NPDC005774]